jgi:hypothetical protein
MPFTNSTNNFGPTKWSVNSQAGLGTHTTLATAMTAASSGDTIILETSVTENVTITPGVNIVGLASGAANLPAITGTLTMTGAGTSTISGLELITNSNPFITVSGSAASILYVKNCYLNASNNTGISYTSSSSSSQIWLVDCDGTTGATNLAFFVCTTTNGSLFIEHCNLFYGSASTTASTTSSAQVTINHSQLNFPLSCTSVGSFNIHLCEIQTLNQNTTCLTTAGTGISAADFTQFASGSASAISVGAGTTLGLTSVVINSTNTNALTGAGTLNYNSLYFAGTSSAHNVTTEVIQTASDFQKIVVQTFTTGTSTYTPTAGMKYCIVELQAPGGGGGATTATGATGGSAGSGGGAGGYSRKVFTKATIGTSQTVTMGAVGTAGATSGGSGGTGTTSTFGALLSCTGGGGGQGLGAFTTPQTFNGGSGGTGSGGDVNIVGNPGGVLFLMGGATGATFGGFGGGSYFGAGGVPGQANGAGGAGQAYGGGGGGGSTIASGAAAAGGAGGAGICIVTEYI